MSDKVPILIVENLSVSFSGDTVLEGVSFAVEESEMVALIGPNGAGKTVLLKSLLGLVPYSGAVHWRQDVKIGYVPQRFTIERGMPITVREFFLLHERDFLLAGSKADNKIAEALRAVNLPGNIMGKRLGVLSGGELQRAMIAWALYDKPSVLLFDEPTAGVDLGGEETIYNLLHSLQDVFGITVLIVSHELNMVFQYASSVVCINKKMLCYGEPRSTLTKGRLENLYGEASYFHHLHHDDHGRA